jgi:protein-disulfide isomerase
MAKKGVDGGRGGRRPGVVTSAKRSGPGRGFWMALGVVSLLGIGTLSWVASRPKAEAVRVDPSLPPMKAQGYVRGSPSAPVEVIEFGDFECPSCGQFATVTEPDVVARLINTGQMRIRYIDFPLRIHKNTWDASLAAACANDQGKFWEMHDALFANQDRWNSEATSRPRGPIGDLAKGIGLDMAKYGTCMDSETHRPQIQANLAEAERRMVPSTPTFVFGDKMVPGALPYDRFKEFVDAMAKEPPARKDSTAPAGNGR